MRCQMLVLIGVLLGAPGAQGAEERADVIVYGGTSGGVAAAVQAARLGKTVLLVEPGRHLGGLTTGGLGATDIGNKGAIGGLAREFYQRIRRYYEDEAVWTVEKRSAFKGRGHEPGDDAGWTFEPHVAEKIFADLLKEQPGVRIVFGQRLDLTKGVEKSGTRILAIRMESGDVYRGRIFIDATYEGDLMAKAGVKYHVGREANDVYGETLNGVQVRNATHHQFTKKVDPYVKPGIPGSGLLARVHGEVPGPDGSGDNKVQAYCYRLCATDYPPNRRPWPKPDGYEEREFELLLRNFEAGDMRLPWHPLLMPNRKTDANNNFAFSTDNIGKNYAYPDGDYSVRAGILEEHMRYQKGLMWTLANHPRVPEPVRKHFQTWGLAKDEFRENDNWPRQLYIREARRMIGSYVMTEHNCRGTRSVMDSIGLAAYTMDSHNIQRYVAADGSVRNEGDVQVGGFSPYGISYESLVPKEAECGNLLVPVCLSASHIAYGSIRMEPVFMVLGQSAATAGVLALNGNCDVQKVEYAALRAQLLRDRQVLEWTGPRRTPGAGAIDVGTLKGIVVDDTEAERSGFDAVSSAVGPYVGLGYRHDGGTERGKQKARYLPEVATAGRYEVRMSYSPNPNRATNVPVTVVHADGKTTLKINQRLPPPLSKAWISLGTYRFDQGKVGGVEISNAGVDGHVIIDAVQWLPK